MFTVPEDFHSKGAAWKAVFVISELERAHLAKMKDVVARAESRDAAENLKQYIIDEAEAFDHVDTGKLQNSIGVRSLGDGEFGVTAVDYAKYVNGRDREQMGEGFIDVAVNQALLDGDDVEVLI